jgi:Glycosyl transferases group 1
MLHDELIVCFSTLSWDYLWLRHQEVMARFARAGNRVLFVEPLGIRMPNWQDRGRIVARLRNRQRAGERGVRPVIENVWVVDPLVNPFQQIGLVHQRNIRAVTQQLENAIQQVGGGTPIFWTFVPTPLARAVIARIPHKLVVYDCMDALTENPKGVFASFAESETSLSREADIVFVTSHRLFERQKSLNPHTYYVPHGVQYEKFADKSVKEPVALAPILHPRLEFFGGIDERVDIALLTRLAQRHADWQIVLMGVVRTDIGALAQLPNVHFLGHVAHADLPAYLHFGDVFFLPYARIAFSEYMNPAKLHECLAVGKPTVATALPVFEEYRDVLRVAETADAYEELVIDALREGVDQRAIEKRRARARENTWETRFDEINGYLEPLLAVKPA